MLGYLNFIILYPKFLSPDQLGLTRVLISVAVLFSQFALLGSSYTLLRYFPYFNNKKEKHFGILTYASIVSQVGFIVFGILFYVFRYSLYDFFRDKSSLFIENYFFIYPIAFFFLVFEIMFLYSRSLLKTVVPVFIKEVLLRLLQSSCLLIYIFFKIDFNLFLILFSATYALHYLVLISYIAFLNQLHLFSKIRMSEVMPYRTVNRYGIFTYATSIASIYTSSIDVIMLGALAGLTDTAIYSVAFFIGTLVIIPSRAMNQVAIPIVAEAWKNHDLKKLKELYQQTAINQFIIGSLILMLVWINMDLLLSFLPPIYKDAKWVMLIIGCARLLDMATGINGEIILYSKHIRFNLVTNIFLIIVSTAATYLLIPLYGVIGAAISIPIAYIFYNGIRIIFLYVNYNMQPFTINNLKVLFILLFFFGAISLIPIENIWIKSIFESTIFSVLFIIANYYLHTSTEVNKLIKKYLNFQLN